MCQALSLIHICDVVWITLSESARVNEELAYYGEELDSALVYLELFAPDTEKQEFESLSLIHI